MKFIIGLGNPGKKYANTRHSTGFLMLEALKKQFPISNFQFPNKILKFKLENKLKSEICELGYLDEKIILAKPQFFMNRSGEAVKKILLTYKPINLLNLYIVHDDLDLPFGKYKIQFGKGPGKHNGILSVEQSLKSKDFWRVRIGVRGENYARIKEAGKNMGDDYLLRPFAKSEQKKLKEVLLKASKELTALILNLKL